MPLVAGPGNRRASRSVGNRFPMMRERRDPVRERGLWGREAATATFGGVRTLWKETTMKILKWAAVAVTALFALMNLGAVADGDIDTVYRVVAAVLAILGAAAAVGLGANQSWGRVAVVGVGALNVAASITGLFTDQAGAVIGIVVGGLGVVLGALAASDTKRPVAV